MLTVMLSDLEAGEHFMFKDGTLWTYLGLIGAKKFKAMNSKGEFILLEQDREVYIQDEEDGLQTKAGRREQTRRKETEMGISGRTVFTIEDEIGKRARRLDSDL